MNLITIIRIVQFCGFLRNESFRVSTAQLLQAIRALPLVDLRKPEQFKDALRATLTSNFEEYGRFDELFHLFWSIPFGVESGDVSKGPTTPPVTRDDREHQRAGPYGDHRRGSRPDGSRQAIRDEPPTTPSIGTPDGRPPEAKGAFEQPISTTMKEYRANEAQDDPMLTALYSPLETLCESDIGSLDPNQIEVLRVAIRYLASKLPQAPSRRRRSTRKRTGTVDVRSTLRDSLRWEGDPLKLHHSRKRVTRPRVVLLADVSGSMKPYTEFLLEVLVAARKALPMVETFVFSTRLTRITSHVRSHGVTSGELESLTNKLSGLITHWGGGTDIGKSLKAFNDEFGPFLLSKKTTVVIMSDGWDRGDPGILSGEIRRVRRGCASLVWLNPLMGDPGYEPICEGIRAALPFIDVMYPAHNVSSFLRFVRHYLKRFALFHGHKHSTSFLCADGLTT